MEHIVQDMYAFSIASSQREAGPIEYELHPELMAQPPFDPFLEIQACLLLIQSKSVSLEQSCLKGYSSMTGPDEHKIMFVLWQKLESHKQDSCTS